MAHTTAHRYMERISDMTTAKEQDKKGHIFMNAVRVANR